MSDLGGSSFDPDLWSLVSLAERSYQDIEEMASSIGSLSEEALATEAANLNPALLSVRWACDFVIPRGYERVARTCFI